MQIFDQVADAEALQQRIKELEAELRKKETQVTELTADFERNQAALTQTERRFDAALDGAKLGFWTWDMVTNVVHYNERWMSMLGYKVEDFPSTFDTFAQLTHPEDLPSVIAQVNAYLGGVSKQFLTEIRLKEKSGDYRWVLTSGKVSQHDAAGKPTHMVGVHLDIHDRRTAEEELNRSETRLRTMVENSPVIASVIAKDGTIDFLSGGVVKDLGIDPAKYVGKKATDPATMSEESAAVVSRALEGEPFYVMLPFENRYLNASYIPIKDEAGQVTEIMSLSVDITEQFEMQSALLESEARLRAVIDNIPMILYGTDANGIITLSEGKGLNKLGFRSGQLVGQTIDSLFKDAPDFIALNKKALEGTASESIATIGSDHFLNIATPVRNDQGQVIGVIGVSTDVTERVNAEQEREELLKREKAARLEALDAVRLKDLFLATMSHELRTPLNAMIGYQHLMLFSGQLDDDNSHMAQRSIANSHRLLNLINNILDISRMATGGLKIVPVTMSPKTLAEQTGMDLQFLAKEKGLTLTVATDPNLPETILHDEERIGQIVINLVNNAIKFTEKGLVHLRVARAEEKLVIEVQDTGIGIPASQKHVIFDDFVQVDGTSTRKQQGAGLGLSIVRRLALLMQGSVTVETELGKGSTFTVTLPLNLSADLPVAS